MAQSPKGAFEVRASIELIEILENLNEDHKFWRWINKMKEGLLLNRRCGQGISKKRIPNYYKEKHGVNNLYRYGHPEGYRSCYTLISDNSGNICANIIDLMSHPEYEDRFGYKM